MKRDAWMDGVIKAPPLQHTSSIYKSEENEEQDLIRGKSPPHKKEEEERQGSPPLKRRMSISERRSEVEASPRVQNDIPPLWKKQRQGYNPEDV